MRLYPICSIDHKQCNIKQRQSALHLRREIHMPRRIHQKQLLSFVFQARLLGKNGNAAVFFHLLRIQKRILVIHTPQVTDGSRLIKHSFAQCGLTRIHMSHKSDHSVFLSTHHSFPSLLQYQAVKRFTIHTESSANTVPLSSPQRTSVG